MDSCPHSTRDTGKDNCPHDRSDGHISVPGTYRVGAVGPGGERRFCKPSGVEKKALAMSLASEDQVGAGV
jgi:hypothetical protein